ncbi:hypothetical protein KTU01_34550 [Kocuria turfanensis]|uniref:Family 65 glycosyl hydrolase n=1 Tax=Kocuria turfanensis TaxID=388357 RepID=A0A512II01_9MICC|nr:hypothetical protein KTU01_34550 [Kocuria turfanensis]
MTAFGPGNLENRHPSAGPGPALPYEAVLFTLDEVLTPTALARVGVRAYPGTIALLERLRVGGVPIGLITPRADAQAALCEAGVHARFDVIVDGQSATDHHLPDPPDPSLYWEAARRLGVSPQEVAVVEDTVAGVRAARAGGFGLVVGIDRTGVREALEGAGADLVLGEVSELDLGASRTDPWRMVYHGFDPAHEGHREALTTLGNGYMATRGAHPERRDDGIHYPGTYLAGTYNRTTGIIHGQQLEEEHLVNTPNWLPLDLRIGEGPWWSTGQLATTTERRELDLRHGVLTRSLTLRGLEGQCLSVVQRRLVSMHAPHLAALETTVTAQGFSGSVSLRSGIDAGVTNTNVHDYIGTGGEHLTAPVFTEPDPDTTFCQVQTTQSQIRLALAVRTTIDGAVGLAHPGTAVGGRHWRQHDLELIDGQPVTVLKTAAVATSRDRAISSPTTAVMNELTRHHADFTALLEPHAGAWRGLWDRFAITFDADRQSQLVLNLHMFHLLQTISEHTTALDAGVPARGLHGEGYRGHVFWDELFVFPVLGLRVPEVTEALLDYRWHRLDAARAAARAAGLNGAMFPWQSGSDGREETPRQLYNRRSHRWVPDRSYRQRHVGLAVAYNAWQHYQATGDRAWLASRGAELIIEVTRLFASMATYDPEADRFHIDHVMGPDEYHDGPPDDPGAGLRDNAYTNVMTSWLCDRTTAVLTELAGHPAQHLNDRLRITAEEIARWDHLARRLDVPFHDQGIISQFAGYEDLRELDWAGYSARYGNIERLDLILEAENDSTNRYKLAKQADVLMLIHLLGPGGTTQALERLGYAFDQDNLRRTVEYYLTRTAHGSTLSRVVHTSVLAQIDTTRAWTVFRQALLADLDDTQGGTTREGVHLGAMSGTLDIVVRAFAGLHIEAGALAFTPRLPEHLRQVGFQVLYRGHRINVTLSTDTLHIHLQPSSAPPVHINVAGDSAELSGGQDHQFPLTPIPPVIAE